VSRGLRKTQAASLYTFHRGGIPARFERKIMANSTDILGEPTGRQFQGLEEFFPQHFSRVDGA
jgi:hypothetical protein